jgi:hypothetical protein
MRVIDAAIPVIPKVMTSSTRRAALALNAPEVRSSVAARGQGRGFGDNHVALASPQTLVPVNACGPSAEHGDRVVSRERTFLLG